jgi:hypothetical protein
MPKLTDPDTPSLTTCSSPTSITLLTLHADVAAPEFSEEVVHPKQTHLVPLSPMPSWVKKNPSSNKGERKQ